MTTLHRKALLGWINNPDIRAKINSGFFCNRSKTKSHFLMFYNNNFLRSLVHQSSVLHYNLKVFPQATSCNCSLNRWENGNLFLLQASPNICQGLWQLRMLLITNTSTSKKCQISFLSFSKSRRFWGKKQIVAGCSNFKLTNLDTCEIILLTYIHYI